MSTSNPKNTKATKKRAREVVSEEDELCPLSQSENPYPWLKFPGKNSAKLRVEYLEQFALIKDKQIVTGQTMHRKNLTAINLTQQVKDTLQRTYHADGHTFVCNAWERVVDIRAAIFIELVQDFFSTFRFNKEITDFTDSGMLNFRLGGVDYELSLINFAEHMGIYTKDQVKSPIFMHFLKTGLLSPPKVHDYQALWDVIGKGRFNPSRVSSSKIKTPIDRIIHRLLAFTISQRKESTERVSQSDLWYLAHIWDPNNLCNVPYCLAAYLHTSAKGHRSDSSICGGHYITVLANALGVFKKKDAATSHRAKDLGFIDLPMLQSKSTKIIGVD